MRSERSAALGAAREAFVPVRLTAFEDSSKDHYVLKGPIHYLGKDRMLMLAACSAGCGRTCEELRIESQRLVVQ